ncbi:hypothetical protein GCM10027280_11850 [Micromonospora polyrhachis]|uniref:Transposase n=1 Tax=Micromonospora polyrhachis TaxID=1282883 RepID=A0A7W7SS13_9ACTN|nr:transposase [Micromonospora polyrhachis]MBB4959919.1 hypothetical protein [Micromonospora polyrhachis]
MALVRVYCGLASADSAARPASAASTLTSAVVDDAGRLLHVCEISDDPAGYARLGALLVERSGGPSGAAIAADSDDHLVTSLLSAGGRPLAIADDDSVDDFAERFADDESLEEMQAPPVQRRAVGLARALQAGALSAAALPAPRDLAGYKPVLAAHAALASGRHAAAVALREVLRELYPAALRAYPDPAETVPLAVLDALPEPGMLTGAGPRGRDTTVAADAIAAHLTADGVADPDAITEAVTALRIAIAETSQRSMPNKALTSAVAETVRQAVAAVRACDAGCDALVATLAARTTTPPATPLSRVTMPPATPLPRGRRAANSDDPTEQPAPPSPVAASSGIDAPTSQLPRRETRPTGGRRSRPDHLDETRLPVAPQPITPPPVAPAPLTPPPTAPPPVTPLAPAAALSLPGQPTSGPPSIRTPEDGPIPAVAQGDQPANRPVSAPPPPPPGMMPMPAAPRGKSSPAEAGEPFRATLTTAAINSARAEQRQRLTPIPPRPPRNQPQSPEEAFGPKAPANGFSPTDLTLPVPAARPEPEPEPAPPGSRANWPLVDPADKQDDDAPGSAMPYSSGDRAPGTLDAPTDPGGGESRIKPPWLSDDLPQEPPALRLVESPTERAPLPQRPPREDRSHIPAPSMVDEPPLRAVEPQDTTRNMGQPVRPEPTVREHSAPPVTDEGDGDLLIFAAVSSAWFTDQPEESETAWSSMADSGWRAAEQAAHPAVGAETRAGLPKRVPQANLVPGSPLREERPLRIVRDAAAIAESTTGYFQGWRRGQEIGGFAVGGRPGRESAAGWDFSRDHGDRDESQEYEYRSAGYRS